MENLHKQEIDDLTFTFRFDDKFRTLRTTFLSRGVNVQTTLMVSFFEDEEGEFGIIVNENANIYAYSRPKNNDDPFSFVLKDITTKSDIISNYPQISTAIQMIKNQPT